MNASVQPTDGNDILRTIVIRMNKLIKEKVDAVMVKDFMFHGLTCLLQYSFQCNFTLIPTLFEFISFSLAYKKCHCES